MTRAPRTLGLFAAFLAGSLVLAAPAFADDPRLVEQLYNPDQVVAIEGRTNIQTTIRFGEDERIENVAIGDSTAWQVTPNKRANLLFVKPLSEKAKTNMTVVTDRHTYLFDLVASPAHRTPLYVLAFTYPEEPEEQQAAAPAETANAVELAAATDPYAVVDPAAINRAWSRKGSAKLLPTEVYDDGDATFLTWPAGTSLPAILIKNQEGVEGPVNYAVRGDVIVVDGVPREIVLRLGDDMATLRNDGPIREPRRESLAQAAPATETTR